MATGSADAIFVDTNVLIAANVVTHPRHAVALDRLKEFAAAGVELWISRQVLRPQMYSSVQPMSVLGPQVAYFQANMIVADDIAATTSKLLALLQSVAVGGKQVHDANIVATMQVNNVTRLLTDNGADFARFEPNIAVVPLVANP